MKSGHISEERLTELALASASTARNGEAAHLAGCEVCASALEAQRSLTAALLEIAPVGPCHGFTDATVDRFRRATRARVLRQVALAAAFLSVICAPTASLLVGAWSQVVAAAAGIVGEAASLARACSTVASTVPLAALVFVGALCLFALAGCWLLARMARRSGLAKYPASRSVPPAGNAS